MIYHHVVTDRDRHIAGGLSAQIEAARATDSTEPGDEADAR
jgi:hypothetical protein